MQSSVPYSPNTILSSLLQYIVVALRPLAGAAPPEGIRPGSLNLLHRLMMRLEWRAGDFQRARIHADALVAAGAECITARLVILHELVAKGELREAAELLNTLTAPLPRRPAPRVKVLRLAADISSEMGDTAAARRWAMALLAMDPDDRRTLKRLHRASLKSLPLEDLRAEVYEWLARGGASAEIAAPTALRIAFHEDRDWRAVIEHADRLRADHLEATTHRILALGRLGEFEAADAALAHARAMPRDGAAAALFRDELDLAEANLAQLAGDVPKQLACINRLLYHYSLAPIALGTDVRGPLVPASVSCEVPSAAGEGPRVAVVMTVYGRDEEAALRAAVDSILAQSYRNLELILVDDCSPDNTLDLLQAFAQADRRVRVYQTLQNGGTYRAKNLGITKTDAEFVTFMDSDDWAHPQRIARQVQSLMEEPSAVAVVHNCLRIEPDGWVEFRQRGSRLAYISTMLRRTVIEQLGYFDAVRVSGDAEMLARIRSFYGAAGVRHEPLPTVLMARRAGSLTGGGAHYIGWRSVTGDRWRYHRAFKHWHQRCQMEERPPFVDVAAAERPFPAPATVVRRIE